MSENSRLQARIADRKATLAGLRRNIRDAQRRIDRLQGERSRAGQHHDALLRPQEADRQLRQERSSIDSTEREIRRTESEIRGLRAELASHR